jgi:transcriptional regulator with XRE-family HTH domain
MDREIQNVLPQRLRQIRENRGLSQRELGRRCELGVNQINRYENGLSDPTIHTLRAIAYELAVSTDYLLGLSDQPQELKPFTDLKIDEQNLINTYRREGWPGVFHLGANHFPK